MAQGGPPQSRTKKRKAKPTRRARLTRESILELSQIPSASGIGSRMKRAGGCDRADTLSQRRQGVIGAKPKPEGQRHHELNGDEMNGHGSRDGSPLPPTTRTSSQTGKRRRVKGCEETMGPEREVDAYRWWVSPAARERLDHTGSWTPSGGS